MASQRIATTATNQPTVHVLATTPEGTRAALATAVPLARGSRARLILLVPQIVPYPLPVDRPTDASAFAERRYRDLVEEIDGDAAITVCLCRTLRDIEQAIPSSTTVVLGGPSGGLLASREEKLARRLTRLGYHTVFAAVALGSFAIHAAVIAAILALLGAARRAEAQPGDGAPADWQYGGFVDVGYLHDFNDPENHLFRSRGTAFHVNEWDLNMAGAYVKKRASDRSRWGSELLIQGGKDAEVFGFSATAPNLHGADTLGHFGLANVSYLAPVGEGLAIQGGIFASLIGYDSLYAKDNFNYTRPWSADFTPYLMMGVNASYPVSDKATATAFIVNGYWHLANANNVPSLGGQLAYKFTPGLTLKETMLAGPHQSNTALELWRVLSDTIVELKGARTVTAFEYQASSERRDGTAGLRAWWMSAQLPFHWNVRGPWSVSLRPEAAWDSDAVWTGYAQSIVAMTSTLEYRQPLRWSSAVIRLEHRFDRSRGPGGGFFTDGAGSSGEPALTPNQHLLILGLIFTFDSPAGR